jgi:hypothetical protein
MRSSFIDWLLQQHWRNDEVGFLAKWVMNEPDFEPLEFHDLLARIKENPSGTVGDADNMKTAALDSLLAYAAIIAEEGGSINVIDETELTKERLKIAVSQEKYEEAAKLRDKINDKNKDDGKV